MNRLSAIVVTLALLAAASACGRYGPPRRMPQPAPSPTTNGAQQSQAESPLEVLS
jgi:predicted small lipoprotein YifL